jgi:transcriptional regulator of acetoin/glycerol metabolism
MIRDALDRCGGNILKTAELLGLSRAALYRRLEKFGIRVPD